MLRTNTGVLQSYILAPAPIYHPADRSVTHPEEIRYRLHGVVARGVGSNHRAFRVFMCAQTIVQRFG